MKPSPLLLSAACALLLLPGCLGGSKKKKPEISTGVGAGQGATVAEQPVQKAQPEPPGPNETLYICDLEDASGRPVAGVRVMLLSHKPEGLYIKEPRRASVMGTYKSPLSGRVFFKSESDGQEKYLWFGGLGLEPFVVPAGAAVGGKTYTRVQKVEILPIAKFIIKDHRGDLVADAIVTMKPTAAQNSKFANRGMSANYGNTKRSDDLGVVTFSRPPGEYSFIATKANGTCRLEKTIQWDGDPTPIEVQLPERTPGR